MQRAGVGRAGGRAVLGAVLACLLAGSVLAPPAVAEDRDAVLEQVRRELAESSEAMVQAAASLRRAQAALPAARREAEWTARRLTDARRREEVAKRRRGAAQVELMVATRDAEETASLVEEQRVRMGRLARAAYQGGGSLGEVSLLLEARSPADFAERLIALRTVVSSQHDVLADLRAVRGAATRQAGDLERIRDRIASAHEEAQAQLAAVAVLAEEAKAAEAKVTALVRQQRDALAAARAAQAEDEQRLAALHAESSRLSALLAARARAELGAAGAVSGATVRVQPGVLARPVAGSVTSPFGMRVHPITGVHKLHTGTDFGAPCGTPIRAARAGTVLAAEFNRAYGWRTVVVHGAVGGVLLTTTYNHQQDLGVETGQQVAAGEVIGAVGSTGYSTGCHLHFELIVNADVVDPLPWLAAS